MSAMESIDHDVELPDGAMLLTFATHVDDRGSVTEVYRREWGSGVEPLQWVLLASAGGVLRGVHVHWRHDDYLVHVSGRVTVGLRDLRRGSPTEGLTSVLEMRDDDLSAMTIPHGVAHGFYYHVPSVQSLGVSHYYDPEDELGCHWADPALGMRWPVVEPRISARDAALPPLAVLLEQLDRVDAR
jgi:dTDP-4-dehydrorhamnose 3,5-epimerase